LASAIKQDRAIQAWIAGDDNRFGNSLLQELDARTEQDISRLTNAVMPYIVGKVGELGAAHYFLLATSAAGDIGEMASESLEAAHLWSNIGLIHAPSMVCVVPGALLQVILTQSSQVHRGFTKYPTTKQSRADKLRGTLCVMALRVHCGGDAGSN
jgi:hypothetical protein